jgi:hypothetical protein
MTGLCGDVYLMEERWNADLEITLGDLPEDDVYDYAGPLMIVAIEGRSVDGSLRTAEVLINDVVLLNCTETTPRLYCTQSDRSASGMRPTTADK